MKKYRIDGERPWEVMTDEEYEQWLKKHGLQKCTEEEYAKFLEEYYEMFPEERDERFTTKKGDFILYDRHGNVIVGKEPKKKDTQK